MDREYDAFYRVAGEFIREWAEFELYLSWLICALLNVDQFRARVILGSIRSFRGKTELITQLAATFGSDAAYERIVALMRRAKNMGDNRNIIAHHMGGVAERKNRLVFLSDKADPEIGVDFMGRKEIDATNLRQWINELQPMKGECVNMFKGCCSVVFASPKMHRERRGDQTDASPDDPDATTE